MAGEEWRRWLMSTGAALLVVTALMGAVWWCIDHPDTFFAIFCGVGIAFILSGVAWLFHELLFHK